MKRKDFEDVDDDVSDFIFSSPATKIRRLDAELPPMVIVEEPEVVGPSPEQSCSGVTIEELPNSERAIVLFHPTITTPNPIMHSPSNFSVSLDPRFIAGWKDQVLRSSTGNSWKLASDEAATEDDNSSPGNGCQAVVPWFPPQFSSSGGGGSETVDDEAMGVASMDIEDSSSIQQRSSGSVAVSQGLPQWQHCTILQPPQNTTTPIVWYR
ncbi:hypothetical protein SASPL_126972 [Salvia splendens]|uniref:Uncharacterized protein n=1 Tax=Salvia splendens TaxID=180675 RepID=A0A8X8ZS78_SALSN|nr:uncharacterized protein LOC121746764 [Salvia splendens]KAG6414254.1 hypothetical protein SASPL_126972 [Salvia splendens]